MNDVDLIYLRMFLAAGVATILVIFVIIDSLFMVPEANDRANNICKIRGFDQYVSYSRFGILSNKPIAVKCEYAERYTDLGVRTNG